MRLPGTTDAATRSTTDQDQPPEVIQRGQPVVDHAYDPPAPWDDHLVLLTSTDGASVELRPTRYEHSVAPLVPPEDDELDTDWLQIAGAVRTASGQGWRFEDPCLTTREARELGRWLRTAAQGEVPVTLAPDRDPVGVLEFTEPELAFSIAAREGEHLVVRVHLAQLATPAPPWPTTPEQDQSRGGTSVLTLTLRTTSADLLHAVHAWKDDLAAFPRRPAVHRR